MPHISIKLWPGRPEEAKRELAEAVAADAARILGADRSWISVAVEEISPERWDEEVFRPEIAGKRDKLYIRPADLPEE